MGFRWAFILFMILPALAQSELSIDAPGVATVNQTIEVLVTSSGEPVSGVVVFFSTRYAQYQRITDERL